MSNKNICRYWITVSVFNRHLLSERLCTMAFNGILRTLIVILLQIYGSCFAIEENDNHNPIFKYINVLNVNEIVYKNNVYVEINFFVQGKNIYKEMDIKITNLIGKKDTLCKEDDVSTNYNISAIRTSNKEGLYVLSYPKVINNNDNIYFCLPHFNSDIIVPSITETYHQGEQIFVNSANLSANLNSSRNNKDVIQQSTISRQRRQGFDQIRVIGLRVEKADKSPEFDENGIPILMAGLNYTLRLFGMGFTDNTLVIFTKEHGAYGGSCQIPATGVFPVIKNSLVDGSIQVSVSLPSSKEGDVFYICAKEGNFTAMEKVTESIPFVHQGDEEWLGLKSYEKFVSLSVAIIIICVCLTFSALFSGLNLGLMSMDRTELKILCNTGSPKEKRYAKIIQPVRNHGNYLLCSILLGNVFVNSILPILLDDLSSGVIAVVCSTLAIVIFGEIIPQAICSRYGLIIGAKTIHITKFVMLLTSPLSYPISKLLDVVLGEEIGSVYNRERLKELVKVTTGENDLDKDEVNIISGALELRKKTVSDVMTKIEDAFMLDYEAILDFETVSEIMKSGYSRVPVYEGDRKNIVTTLYIKDLAFVDPDDNTPLKTLCQFYQNPCNFVFEDVTLDIMFKEFKEGNKGHMAFVNRINSEGEGDPFYETIGLITLEDVIEELIQAEIVDETDVFTDNRTKRRRILNARHQDFTIFAERRGGENNKIHISPQLTLATFQYLSTSVDVFKSECISETILRRLLKQDIIFHVKKNKDWRNDSANVIYQQAKPVDFFVLILEGRVEVTVGKENLVFESGPFTYFGTQALVQNVVVETPSTIGSLQSLNMDMMIRQSFQPDYTVRACTEVLYLKVKRSLYLAAKRATLMERSQRDNQTESIHNDQFDDEVEKLLHSLEDDSSIDRVTPTTASADIHSPYAGDNLQKMNNTSLKSPIRKNVSPTSMNLFGQTKDVNGKIPIDDISQQQKSLNEEEVSLLTTSNKL